MHVIPEDGR